MIPRQPRIWIHENEAISCPTLPASTTIGGKEPHHAQLKKRKGHAEATAVPLELVLASLWMLNNKKPVLATLQASSKYFCTAPTVHVSPLKREPSTAYAPPPIPKLRPECSEYKGHNNITQLVHGMLAPTSVCPQLYHIPTWSSCFTFTVSDSARLRHGGS